MAINFPNTPSVGQIHQEDGVAFIWTGTVWQQFGTGSVQQGVPVGTLIMFTTNAVPNGYLLADGRAVTSAYPQLRALYLAAGSPHGTIGADPRLPDLFDLVDTNGGRFIRPVDGTNRAVGSKQGETFVDHIHYGFTDGQGFHSHGGATGVGGAHNHTVAGTMTSPYAQHGGGGAQNGDYTTGTTSPHNGHQHSIPGDGTHAHNVQTYGASVGGGSETRPSNFGALPCIKAFDAATSASSTSAGMVEITGGSEGDLALTDEIRLETADIQATRDGFAAFAEIAFNLTVASAVDVIPTLELYNTTTATVVKSVTTRSSLVAGDNGAASREGRTLSLVYVGATPGDLYRLRLKVRKLAAVGPIFPRYMTLRGHGF